MANKVVIVGSLNIDTTLRVHRLPAPGETVIAQAKTGAAGGKGANQAVAAARAGAETTMIGQVGSDPNGKVMLRSLSRDGIDGSHVAVDATVPTGSATVLLDDAGQNNIVVYGGANSSLTLTPIINAQEVIKNADFVLAQFEIPEAVVMAAFQLAKKAKRATILNPAPAKTIDPSLLKTTDLVTPNETEAASITGIEVTDEDSMKQVAKWFADHGVSRCLITLGARGVFYSDDNGSKLLPAYQVKPVDTTAAGDTFVGALSAALKPDFSNMEDAIDFAQTASSLTVRALGAQPSIPQLPKIQRELKHHQEA